MNEWKTMDREALLRRLQRGSRGSAAPGIAPEALADIAIHSESYELYRLAVENLEDEALLESVAERAWEPYASILALRKLTDDDTLLNIAQTHPHTEVRLDAAKRLSGSDHIARAALHNGDPRVRAAAARRLTQADVLAQIARQDPDEDVCRSAIHKLSDPRLLAEIAGAYAASPKGLAAFQRLRDISRAAPLDRALFPSLAPLLSHPRAVAPLISLMEESGIPWPALCGRDAVDALRAALSASDAFGALLLQGQIRTLYKHRADLRPYMASRDWSAPVFEDGAEPPVLRLA